MNKTINIYIYICYICNFLIIILSKCVVSLPFVKIKKYELEILYNIVQKTKIVLLFENSK